MGMKTTFSPFDEIILDLNSLFFRGEYLEALNLMESIAQIQFDDPSEFMAFAKKSKEHIRMYEIYRNEDVSDVIELSNSHNDEYETITIYQLLTGIEVNVLAELRKWRMSFINELYKHKGIK